MTCFVEIAPKLGNNQGSLYPIPISNQVWTSFSSPNPVFAIKLPRVLEMISFLVVIFSFYRIAEIKRPKKLVTKVTKAEGGIE